MAKRQRGGSTRPGQRPSAARSTARPGSRPVAPVRPSTSLTEDELAHAAALEAQLVAEERSAAVTQSRTRDRRRAPDDAPRARTRSAGALAAIAADEYVYVRRDLRRIVAMFALIFSLLLVAFILVQALGIAQAPAAA